jgi:hypothetical protein
MHADAIQEIHGCACPRDNARECIRVRYGRDLLDGDTDHDDGDDVCECSCHDAEWDDPEDEEDW